MLACSRARGAVCRRPQGYAIVMTVLFPAGIPLTYLAVLYMGKERINPEPQDPEVSIKKREDDATIQKTKCDREGGQGGREREPEEREGDIQRSASFWLASAYVVCV